jgi:anti-anti-sigma factor
MFEVKCTPMDKVLYINCTGKLDLESFEAFDNSFSENYNKAYQKVIINLNHLHYLSSVGLRSLLRSAKLIYADKNKVFINVQDGMVKNIIMLSGFHKILPLAGEQTHAVPNY